MGSNVFEKRWRSWKGVQGTGQHLILTGRSMGYTGMDVRS